MTYPYDNDPKVMKKECVGHVEKRMGTRLRNAKKTNKGLGGRGKFVKLACLWITEVIHVLDRCAQLKQLLLLPKVCVKTQEPQLVTEHNNLIFVFMWSKYNEIMSQPQHKLLFLRTCETNFIPDKIWAKYEVCKLSNETGNIGPDLATLRRRVLEGRSISKARRVSPVIRPRNSNTKRYRKRYVIFTCASISRPGTSNAEKNTRRVHKAHKSEQLLIALISPIPRRSSLAAGEPRAKRNPTGPQDSWRPLNRRPRRNNQKSTSLTADRSEKITGTPSENQRRPVSLQRARA
ncbi:hypothetical protein NQ318_013757 [Aromia moschata]|uniref:Uncharacterized protein n=1 Tax=Aromia moschata TaxID=1265417 RepID=A0AAV8Z8K5_9CUCU|nr:hypothetical protein NQ318_013757 [Aromia moschata]